jgi:hypothetical protein
MTLLIQALIAVLLGGLLAVGGAFALVSSQSTLPAQSEKPFVVYDGS